MWQLALVVAFVSLVRVVAASARRNRGLPRPPVELGWHRGTTWLLTGERL